MLIREIEELALNAWPSLQTRHYDGWILRFAEGYTRRSNSVIPLYESTIKLDEKIDYCEKQYGLRNLPTLFKITEQSTPTGIDTRLEERGYKKDSLTALRILGLDKYEKFDYRDITIEPYFSKEWLNGFFQCAEINDENIQLIAKRILDNILCPTIVVSKIVDGRVVGCGYGAVERDYVGIFDIVVHKDYRGNGFGKDIMNGILGAALEQGAKKAYLQVLAGNIPAERLYDKLGFKETYLYWYRKLEK